MPTPSNLSQDARAGRIGLVVTLSEWLIAILVTVFLSRLHIENWIQAPMLWRDELTTLHIATRSTLAEVWSLTEWESLPLLWPMVLRTWIGLGLGESAESLRLLALGVGALILASLFFALRVMARTPPLLTLLLVAANPTVIRYGDTIRGYGLGLLLVILLVVAYWKLTLRITPGRTAIAALLSILAVQGLYHNAVVVLALASACAAAWASRRRTKETFVPLAIGGLTALTLIPYFGPLTRAQEWNVLFRTSITFDWLLARVRQAIEIDGPWISQVWALLATLLVVVFVVRSIRPAANSGPPVEQRAQVVFFGISIAALVAGYAVFLIQVGYPTQVWYYIPLLGVAGVLVEAGLAVLLGPSLAWRVFRIAVVLLSLPHVAPGLAARVPQRLTNMDLVADVLEKNADPNDLILVSPWYLGISFDHYYGGRAPWLSIPDLSDRKLTRYDLVKEVMTRPDAMNPIANRVEQTLTARGRVWVVGSLPLSWDGPPPSAIPVAPSPGLGWSEFEYQRRWSAVVAHRIQRLATRHARVQIDEPIFVGPFERPGLQLFSIDP